MNEMKLASLTIGLAFAVTGCNHKPTPAYLTAQAAFIARCDAVIAAPSPKLRVTNGGGETVDASTIDRALSRAEIYSRYSKETAAEFYANGFDR